MAKTCKNNVSVQYHVQDSPEFTLQAVPINMTRCCIVSCIVLHLVSTLLSPLLIVSQTHLYSYTHNFTINHTKVITLLCVITIITVKVLCQWLKTTQWLKIVSSDGNIKTDVSGWQPCYDLCGVYHLEE